jgi:hypothetical protein
MKLLDLCKRFKMRILDGVVVRVFPEFIPIPGLNVGVAFIVVMAQRMIKNVLVLRKVIGQTTVTAVTIAKQDQLTGLIDIHPLSVPVSLSQAFLGSHDDLLVTSIIRPSGKFRRAFPNKNTDVRSVFESIGFRRAVGF